MDRSRRSGCGDTKMPGLRGSVCCHDHRGGNLIHGRREPSDVRAGPMHCLHMLRDLACTEIARPTHCDQTLKAGNPIRQLRSTLENPENLRHRAWISVSAVIRRNDEFRLRLIDVTAQIRHHPIAALG